MAKTSLKIRAERYQKFRARRYTRCQLCGRAHAVLRKFHICRICFRKLAHQGKIPGIKKAS